MSWTHLGLPCSQTLQQNKEHIKPPLTHAGRSVCKVKVKETHCRVRDLLPNAQYELWVMATNTTGISPASEKALYMTGKTQTGTDTNYLLPVM